MYTMEYYSAIKKMKSCHFQQYWMSLNGIGVRQGCILSPCLFNFYAEYIMRTSGLEEAQAGIKIAGRNINNPDTQMIPP